MIRKIAGIVVIVAAFALVVCLLAYSGNRPPAVVFQAAAKALAVAALLVLGLRLLLWGRS